MNNNALDKLKQIYGPSEGVRVYMTVMPGILADFRKMLGAAKKGEEVSEEYILEDKKAVLKLRAHKGAEEISIEAFTL